jgi:hypothetical protein
VSLKKWKSQGKAVEVTVNSKEENSYEFFSVFRPRIRPLVSKPYKHYGICLRRKLRFDANTYCVPAETRPTIMEVLVEDDWTSTVTSTPIITPTTGFCTHKGTVSQEYISLDGWKSIF